MRLLFALAAAAGCAAAEDGLAARYPGDAGIARDPAVVFLEDFEGPDVAALAARWSHINNKGGAVLAFSDLAPAGSSGSRSLCMTATRGANEGGHLYRTFRPGYERLFLRFYVRFGERNGFNHHFVSLGGEVDPPPYPVGRAGLRPDDRWNTGIEPVAASHQTAPPVPFAPPGIWHFYTYWPEMRSWQSPEGVGTSFYGNDFEPSQPVPAPRGQWICVEMMVKMNSPEAADGEQAFWIDGRPAARFAPGGVRGRWVRDIFRVDEENGDSFAGIRWRRDPRVKINKLWLSHYVSETAFERSERYAAAHPGAAIDPRAVTVWFDHLVAATEYIGPLKK